MRFSSWQFWIGLAVSGLFLLLLLLRVDRQEIVSALSNANYLYVAPAIGLYFVAVYFRSIRWAYLLSPIGRFPVGRLYPVVIIGYMANNLLPARLGELVRSYYLAQRETVSRSTALATVAVERVYDGVALLSFVAISAPALLLLGRFEGTGDYSRETALAVAIGTVAIFSLAFAFLVLAARPGFSKVVDPILSLAPAKARPALRDLVHRFIDGLQVLDSPGRHLGGFSAVLAGLAIRRSHVSAGRLFLRDSYPIRLLLDDGAGHDTADGHLQPGHGAALRRGRHRTLRGCGAADTAVSWELAVRWGPFMPGFSIWSPSGFPSRFWAWCCFGARTYP